MGRRGHILVVGRAGAALADAARTHDCDITVVYEAGSLTPDTAGLFEHAVPVPVLSDVNEVTRVAARVNRSRPVDYVVSLVEHGLVPAAVAAERLGLPTPVPSAVALALRDKHRMRATLSAHPDLAVRTARCTTVAAAEYAAGEIGYPVILKPVAGSGSLAVHRADDRAALRDAYAAVARQAGPDVLLEELLSGPEFSVETFSHEGRHTVLAVTRKYTNDDFIETGHVIAEGEPPEGPVLVAVAARFLDLMGVANGNAHTELILTAAGPKVVESQNRPAGDSIPRLVQLATGVDVADWTIGVPLGRSTLPPAVPARRGAAIHFWTCPPGVITGIPAPDRRTRDRCVEVSIEGHVGQRRGRLVHSFDRLGYVIVTAPTGKQAYATARRIVLDHPYLVDREPGTALSDDEDLSRAKLYARGGRPSGT